MQGVVALRLRTGTWCAQQHMCDLFELLHTEELHAGTVKRTMVA